MSSLITTFHQMTYFLFGKNFQKDSAVFFLPSMSEKYQKILREVVATRWLEEVSSSDEFLQQMIETFY